MLNSVGNSEKITEYTCKNYWITCASWINILGHKEFEIGIRRKSDSKFWLLQSEKYNHQSVQEVANAIAHIFDCEDTYKPEWMQEYMT